MKLNRIRLWIQDLHEIQTDVVWTVGGVWRKTIVILQVVDIPFKKLFRVCKSKIWHPTQRFFIVKFIYSENATKFCKIFTLLLNVCTVVKSKVKISQNFTKNLPKFCGLLRINELYNIHKKKMVLGILKKVDLVFFFTLPVQWY